MQGTFCESRFARKDGTSLIYVQYCYCPEKRTLLNTEIAIPSNYWNEVKLQISEKLPISFSKYVELNKELRRIMRIAEDIVCFAIEKKILNPGIFVKKTFSPHFDISNLKKESALEIEESKSNLNMVTLKVRADRSRIDTQYIGLNQSETTRK